MEKLWGRWIENHLQPAIVTKIAYRLIFDRVVDTYLGLGMGLLLGCVWTVLKVERNGLGQKMVCIRTLM